jgi:glycine cleavage system aminomethyltransferase T
MITSSVLSPGVGKTIALGFVSRVAAISGTNVEVESGSEKIPAVVSELPFTASDSKNVV